MTDLGTRRRPARPGAGPLAATGTGRPGRRCGSSGHASRAGRAPEPVRLRDRWCFPAVFLIALLVFVSTDTGRMIFDTKLGVDIDAGGLPRAAVAAVESARVVRHAAEPVHRLRHPDGAVLPSRPARARAVWLIERLWLAVLVTVGFAGPGQAGPGARGGHRRLAPAGGRGLRAVADVHHRDRIDLRRGAARPCGARGRSCRWSARSAAWPRPVGRAGGGALRAGGRRDGRGERGVHRLCPGPARPVHPHQGQRPAAADHCWPSGPPQCSRGRPGG